MKIGTLFARIVPQARNRGFMLVAGFDSSVNQKTMFRYITLTAVTHSAIGAAFDEIAQMTGALSVQDVTRPDVHKRIQRLLITA